jgi:hypothetical protein
VLRHRAGAATRRLANDERGLWDGVARGLVVCDGFGAIRARVGGRPADVAEASGVDVADDTAPEVPDGPEAFDVLVRAMSTGRELR